MGYRKYTEEFKGEVLTMAAEGSRSVAHLEHDLDITPGLIYKWQQRYRVQENTVQPSAERAEQAELRRLKPELEIVKQERDILKKAIQVFSRGGAVGRYRFVAKERSKYPVRRLCAVLQVSVRGFYAWLKPKPSRRAQANAALAERIRMGLVTKGRRRFKGTTQRQDSHRRAPNVLAGDFSAQHPNDKWLSDITYIPTAEGWLYLAGIQDVFSRRIVGWSMGERPTKALVCQAWQLAVRQRGAPRLHHSDQGSQYTSDDYLLLLEQAHVTLSMSDVGRCYDNAMQESFWGTLKTECADRPVPSRAAARQAIFEYIEIWYNRQRRHSALGHLSTCAFEQLYCP